MLAAPVAGLASALAFYKVNGKSFIEILEAGFNYYIGAKLFLWKHKESPAGGGSAFGGKEQSAAVAAASAAAAEQAALPPRGTPKLTRGKLSELAWSLDVKSPTFNTKPPK